jgi:hypothetical protein
LATSELVTNATFAASHAAKVSRRPGLRRAVCGALALAALPLASASAEPDKETAAVQMSPGGGVANLPYARGKTFGTLDEYLAHLEALGAVDLPWWREIRPGVYERVTTKRPAQPEVATRAELMRRFGFAR